MEIVVLGLLVAYWLFCNVVVAHEYSIEEMREDFITDQCWLGKIGANSFYWLAWLIKAFA
jgi:hypothetical protein